jgi:hypothetical protein
MALVDKENEFSDFIKCLKILDYLSEWRLLQKESAQCCGIFG